MKIFVKTKPNSKENKVTPPVAKLWKEDRVEEYYLVSVKEPPVQGKANDAVVRLLAEYFETSRSQVKLVSGSTSKIKVFEILDR